MRFRSFALSYGSIRLRTTRWRRALTSSGFLFIEEARVVPGLPNKYAFESLLQELMRTAT